MTKRITVTTDRSNAIVRRGETVEVKWTPRIGRLIEAGRLTALTALPDPDEPPSKDDLIAEADRRGVYVAKSWTKDKIAAALTDAGTEEEASDG